MVWREHLPWDRSIRLRLRLHGLVSRLNGRETKERAVHVWHRAACEKWVARCATRGLAGGGSHRGPRLPFELRPWQLVEAVRQARLSPRIGVLAQPDC
jgi:hypothetical protein